ncbi:hypothetical protein BU198_01680 [Streptomyces sp. CBMA156]|nr:hypothetical protein [Streptomyces sp. CBMA156]
MWGEAWDAGGAAGARDGRTRRGVRPTCACRAPRRTCGRDWGLPYDAAYGLMGAQVVLIVAAWVLPPRTRWAPWRFVASAGSVMCGLASSVVIQNFG